MALVALLLAAGCQGDTLVDTDDPAPRPTADTAAPPLSFVAGPALTANSTIGLAAWLTVETDAPSRLDLTVRLPDASWTLSSPEAGSHRVPVLGLHADERVEVDVVATAADGRVATATASLRTAPLPDDLVAPVVRVADPSVVEPGVTVLTPIGYVVLIDLDGRPCWYLPVDGEVREVGLWDGPTIGMVVERDHFVQLTLTGEQLRRWGTPRDDAPDVLIDVFATHHDLRQLPGGNLLTLAVERRQLLHPMSEVDPTVPKASVWVAGDLVLELTPDGERVHEWHLLDLLDPQRIGYGSVTGDYWEIGEWNADDVHDWSHGNSVDYDPVTDTVLVSSRHQDAVIGLSRTTGELRWILSTPQNWVPPWTDLLLRPPPGDTDFRPFWHQHAAQFTPTGTVVLFDNGAYGASAFHPPKADVTSRAVEYRIDAAAGTAEQLWSWGEDAGLYSSSLGDADVLPLTDHVLVTFGNLPEGTAPAAKVVEVTRAGEVVWEAEYPGSQGSWYRSGRWTGVLPGPGR